MNIFEFDPLDVGAGFFEVGLNVLNGIFQRALQFYGNKGADCGHHGIIFKRSFKASSLARDLMARRLPAKINFLTETPLLLATAIKTSPTGFAFVPPAGPAIPVIPIPKSVLAIFRIFS